MKRHIILTLTLLLCCNFLLLSADKKNVLIINSYHKGLQWSDDILRGINEGLAQSGIDMEVYTEFADSKRFCSVNNYHQNLYQFYKKKYADINLDVIIVSDDYALTFMLENRDSLFGRIPTVFCGINNPHNYPDTYTGILENIDFKDNFRLIKKLHPNYSKVYFIVDHSVTGDIIYDRAYCLHLSTNENFRFEFIRNFTFDELYKTVSNIDKDAILFLTASNEDRNGAYCSYNNIITNLSKSTEIPIYGAWDFYLGKGIIGGKLLTGFEQGYKAALKANRILNDETVQSMDVEISTSQYIFDYNQLKAHGISRRNLPNGARIINRPLAFISDNKEQTGFWGIILLSLITAIIILIFYIVNRRKRIAEIRRYNKSIELTNEKLLLAKEKIEESDRLKSAFLANMSHELRTPMNGIIGFSKLIIDSDGLSPEIQKKYLNIIHKSGYILLSLVNDIIDLAKLESTSLKLSFTDFKLNELIDELMSFFISEKNNLGKDDVKIVAEKEYDFKEITINSDSNRLRQVLYNLLNNALKFTEKGIIRFGYYVDEPKIVFFVKDTGIGLSKEDKKIIFDRFRQVDDKSTRRYGGSGLGLTISKGIIDNMKGEMWVESEKGVGSSFYFTIPFNPVNMERRNRNTEKCHEEYVWPDKTILIVEDAIVSYDLLTKFLKDSKVNFLQATDGKEAVDLCKANQHIDLVLMDIQLPIMDGLTATNLIKKFNPSMPIIAQTANAMDEDRPNILAAGCDNYISKPINRLELLQKIDMYL